LLTTLKGLPSSYDKDLQEDKEPLFDAFDTLGMTLPVMAGLLQTLTLRPERMAAQLEPTLLATDLADYLVKKGTPFREAHRLVGQVVQTAEDRAVPITALTVTDLQTISPAFEADVVNIFDFKTSLASRLAPGGTAPDALKKQLETAKLQTRRSPLAIRCSPSSPTSPPNWGMIRLCWAARPLRIRCTITAVCRVTPIGIIGRRRPNGASSIWTIPRKTAFPR
jgi:argininosuccinate lyase